LRNHFARSRGTQRLGMRNGGKEKNGDKQNAGGGERLEDKPPALLRREEFKKWRKRWVKNRAKHAKGWTLQEHQDITEKKRNTGPYKSLRRQGQAKRGKTRGEKVSYGGGARGRLCVLEGGTKRIGATKGPSKHSGRLSDPREIKSMYEKKA